MRERRGEKATQKLTHLFEEAFGRELPSRSPERFPKPLIKVRKLMILKSILRERSLFPCENQIVVCVAMWKRPKATTLLR